MTVRGNNFVSLRIENPKVYADSLASQDARLFPYYAGYSTSFATHLIKSMALPENALVLDPWNGSGTTTSAATQLGYAAIGQDLNPVMVLVAKAALLQKSEISSILPLAKSILQGIQPELGFQAQMEPLETWLAPQSAIFLRQIESSVNRVLVSHHAYLQMTTSTALNTTSSLAAFFYVSLFTATRRLLGKFIPSNPTWVKSASSKKHRLRPSVEKIHTFFLEEVSSLALRVEQGKGAGSIEKPVIVTLGNSEALSVPSQTVDAIITSPPYCTRIDYAIATSIELAVLRLSREGFDAIRRSLMGTSTVAPYVPSVDSSWGETCVHFLQKIYEHPSKASKTYYFKNHLQYFGSLKRSLNELGRVLKPEGTCVLVVQDSYYKEIRNDIANIVNEMAMGAGLTLALRKDFSSRRSMVGINKKAGGYLAKRLTTESVLCFKNTQLEKS